MKPFRTLCIVLGLQATCALIPACSSATDPTAGFPSAPYASLGSDHLALSLELRTAPTQPPVRGANLVQLRVASPQGAPRDGLALTVVPWMPAHGHGSPTKPTVTPQGSGLYEISDVNLPMAGIWELRITLAGEGVEDHATVRLEVR